MSRMVLITKVPKTLKFHVINGSNTYECDKEYLIKDLTRGAVSIKDCIQICYTYYLQCEET